MSVIQHEVLLRSAFYNFFVHIINIRTSYPSSNPSNKTDYPITRIICYRFAISIRFYVCQVLLSAQSWTPVIPCTLIISWTSYSAPSKLIFSGVVTMTFYRTPPFKYFCQFVKCVNEMEMYQYLATRVTIIFILGYLGSIFTRYLQCTVI